MPSNRTAAVAYGDKLKNSKYNPDAVGRGSELPQEDITAKR